MEKNAKIYVAGHTGMVGSAIVRELKRQGYSNFVFRTHKELDLTRQDDVERFFEEEKPEYVFHPAGFHARLTFRKNSAYFPSLIIKIIDPFYGKLYACNLLYCPIYSHR